MASAGQVPDREVPAEEFRNAMSHFATGVTVVTSVGADATPGYFRFPTVLARES